MTFQFIYFNLTALHAAIMKGNRKIVDLLLVRQSTEVNALAILITFLLIQF